MSMQGTSSIGASAKVVADGVDKTSKSKQPAKVKDTLQSAANAPAADAPSSKSFGEKIKACFDAIWAWISNNLLCCIFGKKVSDESASESTQKTAEESSSKKAVKEKQTKASSDKKPVDLHAHQKKDARPSSDVPSTATPSVQKKNAANTSFVFTRTDNLEFDNMANSFGAYFFLVQGLANTLAEAIVKDDQEQIKEALSTFFKGGTSMGGIPGEFSKYLEKELSQVVTLDNIARKKEAVLQLLTDLKNTCRIFISKKDAYALSEAIIERSQALPQAEWGNIFRSLKAEDQQYFADQMTRAAKSKTGCTYGPSQFQHFVDGIKNLASVDDGDIVVATARSIRSHFSAMISKYLQRNIEALSNG
jgi:hypothetical protein